MTVADVLTRHDVCITYLPGHRDIRGNCRADELSKRGTAIEVFHVENSFSTFGIPLAKCNLIIDNAIVDTGRTA